jgi:multidrug efflux pump subunit AcrA (membrane-fusion protein)
MAAFLIVFFLITKKWWIKGWEGARYLALEKGGFVRRHAALAVGAAALLLIALFTPLPHSVRVEARLAPLSGAVVEAPFDGRIEEVFARPGAPVQSGAVLALLLPDPGAAVSGAEDAIGSGDPATAVATDPTALRRAAAAAAEGALRAEGLRRADGGTASGFADLATARAALDEARALEARGFVTSPASGRLLTPRPGRLLGRYVTAGTPLFEVGSTDSLAVLLVTSEREVGDLEIGRTADLRLRSEPGRRIVFPIESVDAAPGIAPVLSRPATELVDPERPPARFAARGRIANPDGVLRPGMTGIVRVPARPLSLAQRTARLYARLVRADFWL